MWWWTRVARGQGTVASIAASLLTACAAVGPNFTAPAPPAARAYAMAGDEAPRGVTLAVDARSAGAWWRSLGSAELDGVMAEALKQNRTVAEADANLSRARAEVEVARADRSPRIDANAGAQRERINTQVFGIPGFPSPTISLYSIGGAVNYGLDVFGGTRRRIEAASADAEAQARRADAAYLALTGNVALQAVRIAGLREEIRVVGEVADDDRRAIAIVRKAEAAGGEAASAGLGGQAQLQADLDLLPPLQSQLAQARHTLAGLVGRSPDAWTAPDFAFASFHPPAALPLVVPSGLVHARPDILAAEADLHADTARIGVATANLYPSINLAAGLTQEALTPSSIFAFSSTAYNFGPAVSAPVFHGHALRAQRREAEAQARASLARYQETVVAAFIQVADALSTLAAYDRRLDGLARSQATAQSEIDDARAAYRLGGGAYSPIVAAQRALDQARLQRAQAAGERLEAIVSLYAATASDWGRAHAG